MSAFDNRIRNDIHDAVARIHLACMHAADDLGSDTDANAIAAQLLRAAVNADVDSTRYAGHTISDVGLMSLRPLWCRREHTVYVVERGTHDSPDGIQPPYHWHEVSIANPFAYSKEDEVTSDYAIKLAMSEFRRIIISEAHHIDRAAQVVAFGMQRLGRCSIAGCVECCNPTTDEV